MKHTPNKTLLAMAAAAALLLSGCTKELPNEGFGEGSYLSLSIDGQQAPSTTAYAPSTASAARQGASTRATAVSETAVNNLWVLQFKMSNVTTGTLVKKVYIPSVTDITKIPYLPEVGTNMMLYLVANTNDSGLFPKIAIGDGIDKVKAQTVTITADAGNNFPTDASPNLPMVGQSTLSAFPATRTVQVNLTRTVAKVILKVTNGLTTGFPLLKVTSTQLKKVPQIYSTQLVNAASGFTGTNYYPPVSGTNYYCDYTAVTGTTATYYVAPNVRGTTGTATDERLKTDVTAPSGQGPYCTYVEILGTAKATATSPEVDVRYRLYLGGNNTNDYNLYSNIAYNVDIKLTGLSAADARLKITTNKFDLVQGGVDGDFTSDAGNEWRPAKIGDFRDNGVVFWVDTNDPTKYKVVSVTEWSKKWAEKDTYAIGSNAQSDTDGKNNSAAIKAYFETNKGTTVTSLSFDLAFPAAATCYNYRGKDGTDPVGTWYLPAKSELQYLWCAYNDKEAVSWDNMSTGAPAEDKAAQGVFNDYLKNAGGTQILLPPITSYMFWSSTQNSGSLNYTWYVTMRRNGHTYSTLASSSNPLRCVRDIN